MKIAISIAAVVLASSAFAQTYRPLETTDQARQRQSSENYDTYRNRGNDAPLGGYNRPLGDPDVRGVERPGYVSPSPTYQPQPAYQQPSSDQDWRRRLK
jgi:hypothetical protein